MRWIDIGRVAMAAGLVLAVAGCGARGRETGGSVPLAPAPPVTASVSLLEQTGDLPIERFVAGARRTLDCEIYEVTSGVLADALGAAAQRGVRVRVILEPRAWSPGSDHRSPQAR